MRRADRLFQLVQALRRQQVTTAAQLARRLEVSERTVYRDIQDLSASGVPIEGEAGVGYRLGRDFELPPVMLTVAEVEALVLGARMVGAFADPALARAAASLVDKVRAVLPPKERERVDATALYSPTFHVTDAERARFGEVRAAVDGHAKLRFGYRDERGQVTERVVRPLGLYFWGNAWTVGAWCELREGHRSFRLDRMEALTVLDERFALTPPVTLADFLAAIEANERRARPAPSATAAGAAAPGAPSAPGRPAPGRTRRARGPRPPTRGR